MPHFWKLNAKTLNGAAESNSPRYFINCFFFLSFFLHQLFVHVESGATELRAGLNGNGSNYNIGMEERSRRRWWSIRTDSTVTISVARAQMITAKLYRTAPWMNRISWMWSRHPNTRVLNEAPFLYKICNTKTEIEYSYPTPATITLVLSSGTSACTLIIRVSRQYAPTATFLGDAKYRPSINSTINN